MVFVDRKILWPAVDLPGTGKNDFQIAIVQSAGLQDLQLRRRVNVQIGQRVGHRIQVAGLAGEIEEKFPVLDQPGHRFRIADICKVDRNAIANVLDVERVSPVFRNQAVDQRDFGPKANQAARQGGPDKAETAGDQDVGVGEDGLVERHLLIVGREQKDFL